jgi:hypothetical protein
VALEDRTVGCAGGGAAGAGSENRLIDLDGMAGGAGVRTIFMARTFQGARISDDKKMGNVEGRRGARGGKGQFCPGLLLSGFPEESPGPLSLARGSFRQRVLKMLQQRARVNVRRQRFRDYQSWGPSRKSPLNMAFRCRIVNVSALCLHNRLSR